MVNPSNLWTLLDLGVYGIIGLFRGSGCRVSHLVIFLRKYDVNRRFRGLGIRRSSGFRRRKHENSKP